MMLRRSFIKMLSSIPFLGSSVAFEAEGQVERRLEVGQVWKGICLTSYQPNLKFYYVLISCDKESDGNLWWKASEHIINDCGGLFGGPVLNFLDYEIHKLDYVGHIRELCLKSYTQT